MPALGAGMDLGRIVEWYVAPGDEVTRGSLIALVETDKANIDVEVFEDGIVEELLIEPGTKVPVGTPLARIASATNGAPAEPPTAPPVAATPAATPAAATPLVAPPCTPVPQVLSPLVRRQARDAGLDLARIHGSGPGGTITRHDVEVAAQTPSAPAVPMPPPVPALGGRASPYARRLATERGLDPGALRGTGPDGIVVARDVPAADATPPAEKPGPDDRTVAMRQAIARAMALSNREIPHYYLGETVDLEPALGWLAEHNADRPPTARVLPAALVLKATALALVDHPEFNGYWVDDAFVPGQGIHLGVAINLRRGGLLAPAIRDADRLSLDTLMDALKDLVQRTRSGGLRGSELTDPTITVSNLGDTGVETILGVITPPQVALVGVGRITERPWASGGMLAARRTIAISLAGDHRASDGHRGGRFLGAIAANLARPETL
jgi:pyruvate dehydrogenase E2 component (dihydrolipoamide acetyltransferase)